MYNADYNLQIIKAMFLKIQKQTEILALAILIFYAIPIFGFGMYSIKMANAEASWQIFSTGLAMLFLLSALLMLVLLNRKDSIPTPPVIEMPLAQESRIQNESEKAEVEKACADLRAELSSLTIESSDTIEDLKNQLDIKQQQNQHLENQIHDLRYEIKTLLNLTEIDYSQKPSLLQEQPLLPFMANSQPLEDLTVSNSQDAKALLKQCLSVAQKITGANQFKSSSKLKMLPLEHTTLDLRLLFDAFRSENSALITIFSPKDNKLIFANNQTKPFFGYHPEKFVQEFFSLIKECKTEWDFAIQQLPAKSDAAIPLTIKSKSGESLSAHCHLGIIPTGIFRDLGICVMYLK